MMRSYGCLDGFSPGVLLHFLRGGHFPGGPFELHEIAIRVVDIEGRPFALGSVAGYGVSYLDIVPPQMRLYCFGIERRYA